MATPIYWADNYVEKKHSGEKAINLIKPGQRVFIGSSCGEPQYLVKELAAASQRFTDIEIVRLLSLETTPLTLIANKTKSQSFNIRSFYLLRIRQAKKPRKKQALYYTHEPFGNTPSF